MTRPRPCGRCGLNPVGYTGRECCYGCVPRNRKAPLVCRRCGSDDFYTAGLCRRCHRCAPVVDSCRDCLAWGVTRHEKWLCQACRGWRRRYPDDVDCPGCGRCVIVNERGYCRLCCRHATAVNQLRPAHRTLDMAAINRNGQQLFLADLILKKRGKQAPLTARSSFRVVWPVGFPVDVQQLVLFSAPHDLGNGRVQRLRPPPIPRLAAALHHAIDDHGDRYGWTDTLRDRTRRGIRVLLAIQDTPGARIPTSEAAVLLQIEGTAVLPVLEVLDSVGMLHDDREPPLQTWFATQTIGLPDLMRSEVTEWFHALRDGSERPPRLRPRHIGTVRNSVGRVIPILRMWTSDGHQSLREITRDDVIAALAATQRRGDTLSPLRSLFRYLKARRLVFINPTARLRGAPIQPNQPLPIPLEPVRDAINSPDPARAALAALIAFHALRSGQLQQLLLTDIRDGRLHLAGNRIVVADPVRVRVNAWLAARADRWPHTINPHLFVTSRTAMRTTAVTAAWIIDKLGITPHKIREDRILNEVIATGGDPRRLCDLFGISIPTAQRYVDVIAKPDERALTGIQHPPNTTGSRTQARN